MGRAVPELPLRALLIGVADYPADSGVPSLRGPARDVEAIQELLLYRFQVEPERIRVVTNAEATVEGIVSAFDEHLLQQVESGEEVLFYFSGHGSRVHDVSGRESDRLDSSLVAYDSRTAGRDGSYDVTDDMLYSLFRPLVAKGAHVVVMTDSCHSGGVTRGQVRVRGADAGHAGVGEVVDWPFWPEGVPFFDDDQRDGSADPDTGGLDSAGLERFVHLGACAPEQEAIECVVEDGVQGVFTWAILDVMRQLDAGLTWGDVASRAAARVRFTKSLHTQTLWVEGGGLRREVFGSRFVPALDRFVVSDFGSDRTLSLAGGALHGLEVGDQLIATDESGVWSAGLEVVEVGLTAARAVWEQEDVAPPEGVALHAVRVHVGAARQALRVRVVDAELRSALEGSTWAVVDDSPDSPYVVEAGEDGRVSFRTSEGIPIWSQVGAESGELAQLVASLQNAFLREARFQALWQLGDPARTEELASVSVELAVGSKPKDGEVSIALQQTRGVA
ncbi:MAG: caspase family protein, partial [Planctomycetota bacterium]